MTLALTALTVQIIVVFIAIILSNQQPVIVEMTPQRTGQPERCLSCHTGIEPISVSHPTTVFGCVSCHEGDRLAVDKDAAHKNLVVNPSALDLAPQYCGSCHAAQVATVQRSLMATYAGAINTVQHAFGVQPDGVTQTTIHGFGGYPAFAPAAGAPQLVHDFADQCLTCHLSAPPQPGSTDYRSTGCATCHVLYAADGLYRGGDPTIAKDQPGNPTLHQFTTAIPYTQCNHCHNQGNYSLRTMTFTPRPDMPAPDTLTGDEKRFHDYYQPGTEFTQCEWKLDCVDCHTEQEIMGDGHVYDSKTQAQYTQCKTCHGTLDSLPATHTIQIEDDVALIRAGLNPNLSLAVGDTILMTERGEPLFHIRQVGDHWVLTDKATGRTYDMPLVKGSQCLQQPDQQGSQYCHQCHTATSAATP